jgi:hypothetical protein
LAFKLESFLTKGRVQLMGGDPDAALEATEVLVAQGEPEIVPGFALRLGEIEGWSSTTRRGRSRRGRGVFPFASG